MQHCRTKAFETRRLCCRPFRPEDAQAVLDSWASNPRVQLEYGEPVYNTLPEVKRLLEGYGEKYSRADFYRWAIVEKDSGQMAGQIGLCRVYSDCQTAEIDYCIGEAFWGRGYAGEALEGVLAFLFRHTGFQKLEAYHRAENTKSGRVLEKSSMHITDTVERFAREGVSPHGEVCYCITRP